MVLDGEVQMSHTDVLPLAIGLKLYQFNFSIIIYPIKKNNPQRGLINS